VEEGGKKLQRLVAKNSTGKKKERTKITHSNGVIDEEVMDSAQVIGKQAVLKSEVMECSFAHSCCH
jgi:hypothetical protein